jgi:hypothetical protein
MCCTAFSTKSLSFASAVLLACLCQQDLEQELGPASVVDFEVFSPLACPKHTGQSMLAVNLATMPALLG